METVTGRIIKQTGGFYYLVHEGHEIACRARGLFRKQGFTPLVGDIGVVELTGEDTGFLIEVLPRKNSLVRPAVANVDLFLMIISAVDPPPNLGVVDRLLAVCEHKGIDAIVIVTKSDLDEPYAKKFEKLYQDAGYKTACIDSINGDVTAVAEMLKDKVCVLSGNSGAGKSTLINAIDPTLSLETGEISKKLGRGRHTTRTTELFSLCGGRIADTPGFSSIETVQLSRIKKDELGDCFREFSPFIGNCRFTGCSHTTELGCEVLVALSQGKISPQRHRSYLDMYAESKLLKDWED